MATLKPALTITGTAADFGAALSLSVTDSLTVGQPYVGLSSNPTGTPTGDTIFTVDGKWKPVNSWKYIKGEVQTYNLWSVENNKTFYANSLLAHNRCCFLSGTKIAMKDGSEKNIEDVVVGDIIKSFNEKTKQVEDKKVLEMQSPMREGYYNLYLKDGRK